MSWADNSVKTWQNLQISNPKPDLHNINAYTNVGENPKIFLLNLLPGNENMDGQKMTDGWTDTLATSMMP